MGQPVCFTGDLEFRPKGGKVLVAVLDVVEVCCFFGGGFWVVFVVVFCFCFFIAIF